MSKNSHLAIVTAWKYAIKRRALILLSIVFFPWFTLGIVSYILLGNIDVLFMGWRTFLFCFCMSLVYILCIVMAWECPIKGRALILISIIFFLWSILGIVSYIIVGNIDVIFMSWQPIWVGLSMSLIYGPWQMLLINWPLFLVSSFLVYISFVMRRKYWILTFIAGLFLLFLVTIFGLGPA